TLFVDGLELAPEELAVGGVELGRGHAAARLAAATGLLEARARLLRIRGEARHAREVHGAELRAALERARLAGLVVDREGAFLVARQAALAGQHHARDLGAGALFTAVAARLEQLGGADGVAGEPTLSGAVGVGEVHAAEQLAAVAGAGVVAHGGLLVLDPAAAAAFDHGAETGAALQIAGVAGLLIE